MNGAKPDGHCRTCEGGCIDMREAIHTKAGKDFLDNEIEKLEKAMADERKRTDDSIKSLDMKLWLILSGITLQFVVCVLYMLRSRLGF